MYKKIMMNGLVSDLLHLMAVLFNTKKKYNTYLYTKDGPINCIIGFKTETGTVDKAIKFSNGRAKVLNKIPANRDVVLKFVNDKTLMEMLSITPNEMMGLILSNKMIIDGNIAYLQLFNYFVSLLLGKHHAKMLKKKIAQDEDKRKTLYGDDVKDCKNEIEKRKKDMLLADSIDKGVKYLSEPYLSKYSIDDFPRLKFFLDKHFNKKPQICAERAKLLTEWFRKNGFETDKNGNKWDSYLREAYSYKYMMENRKPIIAENELLAGSTTSKQPTGVVIYPDAQGTMVWGELGSIPNRILNPYDITKEDAATLHDVFSFWAKRNFREWVRSAHDNPLCQQIDERWIYYFVWKSVGISHTIVDYENILRRGTLDYILQIENRLKKDDVDEEMKNALTGMKIVLEGVNNYALNLSKEAKKQAGNIQNKVRKLELLRISKICSNVPMKPCTSLDEAVNCMWIIWISLHMENTNAGLSIGRVDQFLQPYFEMDMKKITDKSEKEKYIKNAIELVGCFYMRCTDHLPLVPDIGNYLFGGSSSDQAITLGGVDKNGEDAVCDMTYILLKVTEILSIRDPNVNARYNKKNSNTYLRRLCEVNYVTAATPSMHSDEAVFKALAQHGYSQKEMNRWAATGCVEATLSGRHMAHTGSILMNMVSALEMALNDGVHPQMNWRPGPATGKVEDFKTFEDFYNAYKKQQEFLINEAVEFNGYLAEAHAEYRPTPLLSAFIDNCIEKGKDATKGGARFNTSGSSNIGLADITDSMIVIKKLVYEDKKITFKEFKKAIDADFVGYEDLQSYVRNKIPLFGSGDPEALEMANDIASFIHKTYSKHRDYRGGKYTSGFWSMSQHVMYGSLSGALPSGRQSKKSFTPGLTPQTFASKSFLDNIRDVAMLKPENIDNNEAFNVRLVPSASDSREKIVDTMTSYVKTYFDLGGMQIQFNVVNSDTLKDALAHPENYQNLLVRISGYNAYFVTLNREMQIELIERTEFGL